MIDFIISLLTGLLFAVCALGSSVGKSDKQQFAKRFIVTTALTTLFCFLAFRLIVPNINLADNIINTILILEKGNFSPSTLQRLIMEVFPLALISSILVIGVYLSRHRNQLEGKSLLQIARMPWESVKNRSRQFFRFLCDLELRLRGSNTVFRKISDSFRKGTSSASKHTRSTFSKLKRPHTPSSAMPPSEHTEYRPPSGSSQTHATPDESGPTKEQVLTALKAREAALHRKTETRRRLQANERRRLQDEFEKQEKARIAEEEQRRLEKQRESERRRREEEREAKRRQAEQHSQEQARRREEERRRERAEKEAQKAAREREKANKRMRAKTKGPDLKPYFAVLGVKPSASGEEIRRAYHAKIRSYHPDQVQNLGPELRELAEQKTREINEAYTMIKRNQTI